MDSTNRLGIVGAGQLGRMLATAAARLGVRCTVLSPEEDPPAAHVAEHIRAEYDDLDALLRLAERTDVVTYEFENVSVSALRAIAEKVAVRPRPDVLLATQDRLVEKQRVQRSKLPTAGFMAVSSIDDVDEARRRWSKIVLKSRRLGYDGKHQAVVSSPDDVADAWQRLSDMPAIAEQWIDFRCEVSVLVARGVDGSVACFDVPRNEHENNILRRSYVPSGLAAEVEEKALDIGKRLAAELDYVGLLAVELFVTEDGEMVVNELAPRVHNSGHWTIDACVVSQFEQHVRAVMGRPLGDPYRHSDASMENLLGAEILDAAARAHSRDAVHIYGKSEARPNRKMGHVTRLAPRDGGV